MTNMRRVLVTIAFLATGALSASARGGQDLKGLAEIIRARADYQRMLIEARLASAKELEHRATAELKFAQAAYYRKMQQVLEYEFDRVKREEIFVRSRISEIEFHASRCATLKIGEVTDVTFYALRWLLVAVLPAEVLAEHMGRSVGPFPAEDFIRRGHEPAAAFPGGNLGQLFKFLERNRFSLEEWSGAHLSVLKFLGAVAASVEARVQRYQIYMDGIRAGTLDVWKLPKE